MEGSCEEIGSSGMLQVLPALREEGCGNAVMGGAVAISVAAGRGHDGREAIGMLQIKLSPLEGDVE